MELSRSGFFCDRDGQIKCFSCGCIYNAEDREAVQHGIDCSASQSTSETIADDYGANIMSSILYERTPTPEENVVSLRTELERVRLGNTTYLQQTIQPRETGPLSTNGQSVQMESVQEYDRLPETNISAASVTHQVAVTSHQNNTIEAEDNLTRGHTLSVEMRPNADANQQPCRTSASSENSTCHDESSGEAASQITTCTNVSTSSFNPIRGHLNEESSSKERQSHFANKTDIRRDFAALQSSPRRVSLPDLTSESQCLNTVLQEMKISAAKRKKETEITSAERRSRSSDRNRMAARKPKYKSNDTSASTLSHGHLHHVSKAVTRAKSDETRDNIDMRSAPVTSAKSPKHHETESKETSVCCLEPTEGINGTFASLDQRIGSFLGCNVFEQTPQEMALAGQFYTGQGDTTKCYKCGGSLKNWNKDDSPVQEHAKWFPQCSLSKQNKKE